MVQLVLPALKVLLEILVLKDQLVRLVLRERLDLLLNKALLALRGLQERQEFKVRLALQDRQVLRVLLGLRVLRARKVFRV
jgi:hypothetical protein